MVLAAIGLASEGVLFALDAAIRACHILHYNLRSDVELMVLNFIEAHLGVRCRNLDYLHMLLLLRLGLLRLSLHERVHRFGLCQLTQLGCLLRVDFLSG